AEWRRLQAEGARAQRKPPSHFGLGRGKDLARRHPAQPPQVGIARTANGEVGAEERVQGKLLHSEPGLRACGAKLAEVDGPLHVLSLRHRAEQPHWSGLEVAAELRQQRRATRKKAAAQLADEAARAG